MKCPACAYEESKVVDSRPSPDGNMIRRRRECLACGKRFTTYESIETAPPVVVKRDKSREAYDRSKVLSSIIRCCDKRQVSRRQMEEMVTEIEYKLQNSLSGEVASTEIGKLVMDKLREVDEVAYIRFASVYRRFRDVGDFMEELKKLSEEKK